MTGMFVEGQKHLKIRQKRFQDSFMQVQYETIRLTLMRECPPLRTGLHVVVWMPIVEVIRLKHSQGCKLVQDRAVDITFNQEAFTARTCLTAS